MEGSVSWVYFLDFPAAAMSLGRQVHRDLQLTRLQRVVPAAVVGHDAKDELVELGRAVAQHGWRPVVVRVLDQIEPIAGRVAVEHERPAANGVVAKARGAVLLQGRGRCDAEVAGRLLVQEPGVWSREADLNRIGVNDLGLFVRAESAQSAFGFRGRVDDVVIRGLDGGGVEFGAVVERDVLAQLEGVDRGVG